MNHELSVGVLSAFLMIEAGCEPPRPAASAPAVHQAVVADLDVVAKAMGRDAIIQQQVKVATSSLNAQLIQAAQTMQGQFDKAKAEFGDQPNPERQERLRQLAAVVNQNVRTNKLIARARQQEIQNGLVRQFRNEVRPIAERLARQRRASVVLLSSDNLLWFEAAADITDELIAELRAAALSASATPSSRPATASSSAPPASPSTEPTPAARPILDSQTEIVPATETLSEEDAPGTEPPSATRDSSLNAERDK